MTPWLSLNAPMPLVLVPGLNLRGSVQDPKYKPIKSTHGIFHQRREKCVNYVAHSKDVVCSEVDYLHSLSTTVTAVLVCMVVTCYCIRAEVGTISLITKLTFSLTSQFVKFSFYY